VEGAPALGNVYLYVASYAGVEKGELASVVSEDDEMLGCLSALSPSTGHVVRAYYLFPPVDCPRIYFRAPYLGLACLVARGSQGRTHDLYLTC
jgi:hypothetical protein